MTGMFLDFLVVAKCVDRVSNNKNNPLLKKIMPFATLHWRKIIPRKNILDLDPIFVLLKVAMECLKILHNEVRNLSFKIICFDMDGKIKENNVDRSQKP
jgi:hypothetical protein